MSTAAPNQPLPSPLAIPRIVRLMSLAAIVLASLLLAVQPLLVRAQNESGPTVVLGKIDGTITPVMERYVKRDINQAEKDGAAAVVFEMDTPGGLSSAMDDIVRDILQSKVPVVVYVAPRGARAASAGVYITYAAHVAAMAPGTNIGSASPIFIDASGNASDGSATLQKKVTNDAVSQIVNLANLRGRNAQWAEQAVREAANITADQALQLNVIDDIAPDLPSLLDEIDGRTVQLESGPVTLNTRGATIRTLDMSLLEQFLQLLADPTIAYLLLSFGLLGLYVELSHPGVTVPGVVGGIAVLLGLFALGTLPVNWAGVLLIGLAFILFALDLFVPSFGTLTIGGLISFVLGSYLLIGSNAPPGYEIARPVIWAMAGCLLAFSLVLGALVLRARMRPPATGKQAMIGAVGAVRQKLAPSGMVFVDGELWAATLDSGIPAEVPAGTPVVVTRVDGLRLTVQPATADDVARAAQAEQRRAVGDRREVIPAAGAPLATGTELQVSHPE
jgi:membrane-bound serine protease (ClpP class)